MKTNHTIDIFIVNDDKLFSYNLEQKIQENFGERNIRLSVFESGEACLEKLNKLHPNIVIMDYHLDNGNNNVMTGVQTLKKLKKISPYTDVVMLTNEKSIETAIDALVNGASNYVLKTDTVFRNIVRTLLRSFRQKDFSNHATGTASTTSFNDIEGRVEYFA